MEEQLQTQTMVVMNDYDEKEMEKSARLCAKCLNVYIYHSYLYLYS